MRRPGIGFRSIVLAAIGVIATAHGSAMHAQSLVRDSAVPAKRAFPHQTSVEAGGAQLTVYRQGVKPVRVVVRTDSGTFSLSADSAIIARWADSAATLPNPPDAGEGKKVSFKMWQIRADGDDGAHMRLVRVPTNHGPDLVLAMFNGAWNGLAYLGDQAPSVLAAFRGDSAAMPDSVHVTRIFGPTVLHGAQCPAGDPAYRVRVSADMQDTTCTRPVIEKQPVQRSHTAEPTYPVVLQRAGIEGAATMQFIVDTTGRVDPRTIELLASTDFRFAEACRDVLPRMRFDPATVDGHKVRELVRLPFTFAMHH
jgi:TonB family protein